MKKEGQYEKAETVFKMPLRLNITLGGLDIEKVRPECNFGRKWGKMCMCDGKGRRSVFLQLYFCSANLPPKLRKLRPFCNFGNTGTCTHYYYCY